MKNKTPEITFPGKPFKSGKIIFIADIISGILLLLFLYTSLSKLTHYETFSAVLRSSPLLQPVAAVIVWLLPVTEIVIAAILFLPVTRVKGLKASFILISIFTLYLLYMIAFTPQLPCNCGGVLHSLTWTQHILFNLLFIILAIAGILIYKKDKGPQSESPP